MPAEFVRELSTKVKLSSEGSNFTPNYSAVSFAMMLTTNSVSQRAFGKLWLCIHHGIMNSSGSCTFFSVLLGLRLTLLNSRSMSLYVSLLSQKKFVLMICILERHILKNPFYSLLKSIKFSSVSFSSEMFGNIGFSRFYSLLNWNSFFRCLQIHDRLMLVHMVSIDIGCMSSIDTLNE